MSSAELPEYFKPIIKDIQENFQDNLRRGFNNEGMRLQNMHRKKKFKLDDVAYSSDGFYMTLKNMTATTYPEFRVKRFHVDLQNACVLVQFQLGQLTFEADSLIVSKTMFEKMPMVADRRVNVNIEGLEAEGIIGIFTVEDSYVPKNYYVEYRFESGEVKNEITIGNSPSAMERSKFDCDESSPITVISEDLHEKLNSILHRQFSAVIVEYSVNELLTDERDEISEYKDYLQKKSMRANRIIDNLIHKAQCMSLFKDVELPTDFVISYKRDTSQICVRNTMSAKGTISGFSSITRPSEWSVYVDEGEEGIIGYLSIKDFKFSYQYSTNYLDADIKGNVKATVYKNKFTVKLRTSKGNRDRSIKVDVFELRDIEIDVSGLGSLSWLDGDVRSIVIGHIRTDARSKVVDFIRRKLIEALAVMDQDVMT